MAVDYDPKKAHEYYIKHRKLKGRNGKRRSTKGLSEQQKEQWAYAKDQLSTEHKAIKKSITESEKAERKRLSEETKSAISALRERLKGMSKEEKEDIFNSIKGMIEDLRSQLASNKKALTEIASKQRESENEDYEKRKDSVYDKIKRGAK